LRYILVLLVCCIASIAAFGQTKATVGIQEVYLAKDDGGGKAGSAVTSFLTNDIPIYCIVQLDSTAPVTVKMNLVAENVPGVKPETKVVTTSYTTKDGENRVNFYGRPAVKWTPGKYRADIFVDGKLLGNLPFEIKAPANMVSKTRSFRPVKPVHNANPPQKNPYIQFAVRTF